VIQPTPKAVQVDQVLTAITGKDRGETIRGGGCTTCNKPNLVFSPLELREYLISGMCKNCQDEVFG
jgi:hypothetical protein